MQQQLRQLQAHRARLEHDESASLGGAMEAVQNALSALNGQVNGCVGEGAQFGGFQVQPKSVEARGTQFAGLEPVGEEEGGEGFEFGGGMAQPVGSGGTPHGAAPPRFGSSNSSTDAQITERGYRTGSAGGGGSLPAGMQQHTAGMQRAASDGGFTGAGAAPNRSGSVRGAAAGGFQQVNGSSGGSVVGFRAPGGSPRAASTGAEQQALARAHSGVSGAVGTPPTLSAAPVAAMSHPGAGSPRSGQPQPPSRLGSSNSSTRGPPGASGSMDMYGGLGAGSYGGPGSEAGEEGAWREGLLSQGGSTHMRMGSGSSYGGPRAPGGGGGSMNGGLGAANMGGGGGVNGGGGGNVTSGAGGSASAHSAEAIMGGVGGAGANMSRAGSARVPSRAGSIYQAADVLRTQVFNSGAQQQAARAQQQQQGVGMPGAVSRTGSAMSCGSDVFGTPAGSAQQSMMSCASQPHNGGTPVHSPGPSRAASTDPHAARVAALTAQMQHMGVGASESRPASMMSMGSGVAAPNGAPHSRPASMMSMGSGAAAPAGVAHNNPGSMMSTGSGVAAPPATAHSRPASMMSVGSGGGPAHSRSPSAMSNNNSMGAGYGRLGDVGAGGMQGQGGKLPLPQLSDSQVRARARGRLVPGLKKKRKKRKSQGSPCGCGLHDCLQLGLSSFRAPKEGQLLLLLIYLRPEASPHALLVMLARLQQEKYVKCGRLESDEGCVACFRGDHHHLSPAL